MKRPRYEVVHTLQNKLVGILRAEEKRQPNGKKVRLGPKGIHSSFLRIYNSIAIRARRQNDRGSIKSTSRIRPLMIIMIVFLDYTYRTHSVKRRRLFYLE